MRQSIEYCWWGISPDWKEISNTWKEHWWWWSIATNYYTQTHTKCSTLEYYCGLFHLITTFFFFYFYALSFLFLVGIVLLFFPTVVDLIYVSRRCNKCQTYLFLFSGAASKHELKTILYHLTGGIRMYVYGWDQPLQFGFFCFNLSLLINQQSCFWFSFL